MAQRTICYRSDAGNDFASEHEALKDDLRHFIDSVIKNKLLSEQLTEAFVTRLDREYGEAQHSYSVPPVTFDGIANLIERIKMTRPGRTDPAQGDLIATASITADKIPAGSICICGAHPFDDFNPLCPMHRIEPQMQG